MPGQEKLTVTGRLGDVMRESAQAALSWIRTHSERLGLPADTFEKSEIHVHVPAAAIPKDGPSAGVTIAVSLLSLLLGRPVAPFLGMTGEITLRGKVLPVGGIKEKVLAARRAGVTRVVLPNHNKNDLEDVQPELRDSLEFVFVDDLDEVIRIALGEDLVTASSSDEPQRERAATD
jgi:ATP-dependent Lon protease